jgi:dipeptidyl aminopeptidase/acylaminoacyl peptidase
LIQTASSVPSRLLLLLTGLLSGALFAAVPQAPPPASAFAQASEFRFVTLSPDGKTLAVDRETPSGAKVMMFRVGSTEPLRVLGLAASDKLRALGWADEKTLLIELSTTLREARLPEVRGTWEFWRTLAAGLDERPPRMLLMDDPDRQWISGAEMVAVRPNVPGTVFMATLDFTATRFRQSVGTRLAEERGDSGWINTLFAVDTGNGKGRVIEQGTAYTASWLVDEQGAPLARSEWNALSREFSVLLKRDRGWQTVYRQAGQDELRLAGVTADRKSLVLIGEKGTDRSRAWVMPIDNPDAPGELFGEPNGEVYGALRDPATGVVLGFHTGGLHPGVHWIDPVRAREQRALENAYPGKRVDVIERSADGSRALVRVEAASFPPVYYLVDFTAKKADLVGGNYPGLEGVTLGEVRALSFPARDGAQIPAYLTLPAARTENRRAGVILPHGGPASRDSGGFDWWAQFLATRGYVVLQPQFRGSTGFGRDFRLAGYREWGGRMQDDLSDGVRYLVESGLVDPGRICVVGGSYGGYAALAGATLTPDLYACAVSVNGVSDLPQMLGDVSRRQGEQSDSIAYWREHIGSASDPRVAARSPARHAAAAKAPILLLHGTDDTVVPSSQSETMARALEEAGKPHRYVKLAGEDHWLSSGTTRTQVLELIEAFLAEHCCKVEAASGPGNTAAAE